jgi:hypothetical protein
LKDRKEYLPIANEALKGDEILTEETKIIKEQLEAINRITNELEK